MHSFGLHSINHSELCGLLTSNKGAIEGSKGNDIRVIMLHVALALLLSEHTHKRSAE